MPLVRPYAPVMAILGRIALAGLLLLATTQVANASHTPQHEAEEIYRSVMAPYQPFLKALTACSKQLDSVSPATRDRMLPDQLRKWLEACVDRELRPKP